MTAKLYCVRVIEIPFEYCIEAETPRDAEDHIVRRFWADRDTIARVVVLRVCSCGCANDLQATMCDDCGTEL